MGLCPTGQVPNLRMGPNLLKIREICAKGAGQDGPRTVAGRACEVTGSRTGRAYSKGRLKGLVAPERSGRPPMPSPVFDANVVRGLRDLSASRKGHADGKVAAEGSKKGLSPHR